MMSFVLAAGLLAGCTGPGAGGGEQPTQPGETTPTEDPGGNPGGGGNTSFPYSKDYVAAHLDPNHSITYQRTNGSPTDPLVMTYIHTADGGYYASDGKGNEHLFIKDSASGKYNAYEGTAATGFKKTGQTVDQAAVDDGVRAVSQILTKYVNVQVGGGRSQVLQGTEVILGRDCEKWFEELDESSTLTYWIDKETGVCLKWVSSLDGAAQYVATEFKTGSGVTLPDHD